MTKEAFSRTALIYGETALQKLARSRVIVFGLGGVGGYAVEALARSGIGTLGLVDHDTIAESNLNRQILATVETLGRKKVEVAAERVEALNPDCQVKKYDVFYLPDTQDMIDLRDYDYVVDAIDTVTGKLMIIEAARAAKVPVISAMGAGNKTDPSAFMVADLYETSICPLARVMRRECKKRGIESLKVVYSREEPIGNSHEVPGSTAFTPAVAGLVLAGAVVNDLVQELLFTAEQQPEGTDSPNGE